MLDYIINVVLNFTLLEEESIVNWLEYLHGPIRHSVDDYAETMCALFTYIR